VKSISSADNPRFKALLRLQHSSRERRTAGLSLLDGIHLVDAYLRHAGMPQEVVVSSSGTGNAEIVALLDRIPGAAQVVVSDGLFRQLTSLTTPTGIIAVVRTPRVQAQRLGAGACLLLEDLQDPGNMGSILRSAAAAGVTDVVLSRHCVHAWSPRVLRAGMGAHFMLRIHEAADLPDCLQDYRGKVIATAGDAGDSLFDLDLAGDVAFTFGNEGGGLSPAMRSRADEVVRIPMPGAAESLNVAAAAAVCLFERVRQGLAKR